VLPTQEQAERARSRRRRGRKTSVQERRRRIVSAQSESGRVRQHQKVIGKLEQPLPGEQLLTKEERKALPRARSVIRYSFALYGPDGAVGMFEAGSPKVTEFLEEDWTAAARERFEKRREQEALAAAEAAESDLEKARKKSAKRAERVHPYAKSQEEALRDLFAREDWEVAGQFFEQKRLEGLDFISRRRQDKERMIRRLDGARQAVERLEQEFAAATKRSKDAVKAGYIGRAMRAAEAITKKEIALAEARERLEEVEAEWVRFQKRMG